jgi:DNA uptake protein ComE-like DNA-binding protein
MAEQIDLNGASVEELMQIPGLGRQRAEEIINNRPFDNWNDVKRVPGFSERLVEELQQSGATLGGRTRRAG